MSQARALALLLAVPLAVAACSRPTPPSSSAGGPGAAPSAAGIAASPTVSGVGVVAEVNGAPILAAELEQKAAGRLGRLRQEEYDIRRQALDELIGERLIAAEAVRRSLSVEELLRQEVDAKASLPADQVEAIYEQNKARFAGQTREQANSRRTSRRCAPASTLPASRPAGIRQTSP